MPPRSPRRIRWISALGVLAASAMLLWLPFVHLLDLKLLDTNFAVKRSLHPTKAEGVVLIGVDEETEKLFDEPMALWHKHLAATFDGLAAGGVRGVGVDLNLPSKSYDAFLPGYDIALTKSIAMLRRSAPIVLGVTVDTKLKGREILPALITVATDAGRLEGLGVVLPPIDGDNTIRRYEDPVAEDGQKIHTLAGALARRINLQPTQGYLDFAYGERMNYVPMHQVVSWSREGNATQLRSIFQGKVVFIGAVLPLQDRHFMPVNLAAWEESSNNFIPGVFTHIQAMRCFMGPGLIHQVPFFVRLIVSLCAAAALWLLSYRTGFGAIGLVVVVAGLAVAEYWLLDPRWFLPAVALMGAACLGFFGRVTLESGMKLKERWRLRRVFGGYVSPSILKEIMDGRIQPGLKGERKAICLLFSDIRNFTTLSENLQPEEVIAILNRYFHRMAEAIHRHGGTLDKFLGDGIMSFFGAPEPLENPCLNAFEAAKTMLEALDKLNAEWAAEGRAPLKIGIGLHFGVASVGHVGSESRHEYTAIGDAVNVASRVEGLTKETGYPLLLTLAVVEALGMTDAFDALGEKPMKGHHPMAMFGWPRKTEAAIPAEVKP